MLPTEVLLLRLHLAEETPDRPDQIRIDHLDDLKREDSSAEGLSTPDSDSSSPKLEYLLLTHQTFVRSFLHLLSA